MTATETSIINKITTEIGTATATDRSVLIADLYAFLGAAEKRVALEAKSLEAKSLESKLESVAAAVVGEARNAAGDLIGELRARL